ncbi:Zn-dependent exopeptidase [Bimuria novae-zelandiae CBS 107.79]|uniref:Peptide hydrolase n=1 Tax=Bimuria novae-zelandiae CBS 107.79 TaxID=1447943 RepID=A0A6A5UT33_9PLEO|nr:Zn-dependent exopeptidase [Bimuria novae-zelandiae CBS 107.79]
MKFRVLAITLATSCATALSIPSHEAQSNLRTKFKLLAQETRLIDMTEGLDTFSASVEKSIAAVIYPATVAHQSVVEPLLTNLSTASLRSYLEPFTQFQNRYYNSTYGAQSSAWLLETVQDLLASSGAINATAYTFKHNFLKSSVIATIPGLNARDADRVNNPAPGADDDGSGSVTILEALRVLLLDEDVKAGKAPNSLEFHWYSGEEGGLLGSVDVWKQYKAEGKNAKTMLQQDMAGYSKGTTDKGKPEVVGVITDHVDEGLTTFITEVIDAVNSSPYIHTSQDTIATVNFDHMLQHAKLTVGLAYESAYATEL